MSLEESQGLHNGVIAGIGNASSSFDPNTISTEATKTLLTGAQIAAAGQTLQLSEEETMAAASRMARRQKQREAFKNRNQRQHDWEQKQKTLISQGFAPELADNDVVDTSELTEEQRAFGLTDYESGFRDLDADNGVDTDPPEYERKGTRTYKRTGAQYPIGNRVRPEEQELYRPEATPQSGWREQLAQVERRVGPVEGTVPGTGVNMTDLRERLQNNARSDEGRDREFALVKAMVEQDQMNSDPEIRQYNDFQAEAKAQAIAREFFGGYGSGSMADDAIGRIAEIRKLGGAGVLTDGGPGDQAQVVRYDSDPIYGGAKIVNGVYIDPNTNNPIAIQGPDLPSAFQGANTPNTGQIANAPGPMTASTWLQANLPDYRKSSKVFNDYPQVDIALETTNFANRLRELKGYGLEGVSPNIRTPGELQKAVSYIIGKSAEMGKPLYLTDPETGKQTLRAQPDVQEVMQLLRMTPMDQQKLANALFQMEQASERPEYKDRTGGKTPGVIFDASEMADENGMMTKLERIPKGSTIRTAEGRRSIRTIMEGLEGGPDVTKGEFGQEAGTKPRINRRKPGNMGSGEELEGRIRAQAESRARRDKKPLDEDRTRENIVKARLAEEREERDRRRRKEAEDSVSQFRVDATRPRFSSRSLG